MKLGPISRWWKMIKLIDMDDKTIYIDITSIALIGKQIDSVAYVVLKGSDTRYYVEESPEQILALMGVESIMEATDE